jgi:outer membrane protein TolC
MGFDNFRKSLEDLMNRHTPPTDRREAASQMRDTLIQAKMGLSEMRDALEKARARLAQEERELETVTRRRQMALDINDAETVAIADKFMGTHSGRVELLRRKVLIQEDEMRMAEADVEAMTRDLKSAVSGTGDFGPNLASPSPDLDLSGEQTANEIDALGRKRARAEHQANAEAELEELKRRMGK